LELAKPVLAQNRKQLLEKWLKEDKVNLNLTFKFVVVWSFPLILVRLLTPIFD